MSQSNEQVSAAELLRINQKIIITQDELNVARKRQRLGSAGLTFGAALLLATYISNALLWGRVDLLLVNIVVIPIGVGVLSYGIYTRLRPGGPARIQGTPGESSWERTTLRELELNLALIREERRIDAADLNFGTEFRRNAYKEESDYDIEQFRRESRYYRRVHNIMQSVIIIGSLAASSAASLSGEFLALRWVAVGASLAVGIAAGFTGYFKFRERSFYLQQTADAIEQETNAYELGIARYRSQSTDEERLSLYVEEVHRLRLEQQKREQNLDQPPEGKDDRSS